MHANIFRKSPSPLPFYTLDQHEARDDWLNTREKNPKFSVNFFV